MAEQILQVNFGLNVGAAEYRDIADSVAESFARVPGLRWKVWFLNEEQRRYSTQLENYGTLVARLARGPVWLGLYFPLLDGWREWQLREAALTV